MDIEQPEEEASERSNVLRNLRTTGVLSTSIAKLSGSSRIIPSSKDFHFYDNFQEFKQPLKATDDKSKKLLKEIGGLGNLFGKVIELPDDREVELDDDVALDWLVNVNDEIFERLDASLDEFRRVRKKEEDSGVRMMRVDDHQLDDGFQMVYGKKNKKLVSSKINVDEEKVNGVQEVKMAIKVKPKVPFHIPTLARPQDEYKIIVNNSNQPFEHVWLQKSEDGSRFIHPLEKLDVLDFVDRSESICEPVKPPSIEVTPFKLVEEVRDLKQLANKLRAVDEFAVDLEHNQYRSFQGLTCLMQISTRTEDFVIDTLKLRIQIGPHLREVFKDPTKRKVMHGSDNDILWLQKDFGIYVCNMFDTGQASRVMKLERYSLEYLLNYFCGVAANKEYQNADWRIRPLPHEMVKYAREDTHYLLYIYDLMRTRLLAMPAESDGVDPPLIQVYKRSYDICTQLYEKELLTDDSYLYIYGLHGADLSAQQLAVVSALCEWRDVVARAEDESTGYVLPNRTLIDLAKQMPLTASKLHHALKSKHPYIERNLGSVVSIIRHAIQNADAFEETAEYLKKRRLEMLTHANKEESLAAEESEVLPPEILEDIEVEGNISNHNVPDDLLANISLVSEQQNKDTLQDIGHAHINMSSSNSAEATVQVLKKPTRAFGALLGRRKFDLVKKVEEDPKLEHIKSTVSLPFHTFTGTDEKLRLDTTKGSAMLSEASSHVEIQEPSTISVPLDIIHLNQDSDNEDSAAATPMEEEEAGSDEANEEQALHVVKPFDYEAARKEVHFGKAAVTKPKGESDGDNSRKKKNVVGDKNDFLPQGRRRQAFPASGNRSATFR